MAYTVTIKQPEKESSLIFYKVAFFYASSLGKQAGGTEYIYQVILALNFAFNDK